MRPLAQLYERYEREEAGTAFRPPSLHSVHCTHDDLLALAAYIEAAERTGAFKGLRGGEVALELVDHIYAGATVAHIEAWLEWEHARILDDEWEGQSCLSDEECLRRVLFEGESRARELGRHVAVLIAVQLQLMFAHPAPACRVGSETGGWGRWHE